MTKITKPVDFPAWQKECGDLFNKTRIAVEKG
jgi:hypothetical protein